MSHTFDSAPRDGAPFIVQLAGGVVCEAYWHVEDDNLYAANTDPSGYHDRPLQDPRWWQPLPQPKRES
jgi:hypothetical protein